ncbi:hypothetical protein FSP39_009052 [Pinctada imbricata]|uniref:Uncharacterized protein n=1 Tax=Pinctada imbricata TaxID=66713 RepID=A0AA88YDD0_PINIB|nr:hypothetical protein FSP39_009052 [Pinctada imbricata]
MAMSESSVISSPVSRTSGKNSRPLALPLSPLISPASCDLMSPSSDDREKVNSDKLFTSPSRRDRKSLMLPLSSPCTETKPFADIGKCGKSGKSGRPFTLSLSPVISPDTSSQESDIVSSTIQSTEKTQEIKKSFTLPLSSVSCSNVSSDNSAQVKICKSQRLPISPLVSSDSDSSTLGFVSQSSSGSNSPKKSPSRSLRLPLNVTDMYIPSSEISSADSTCVQPSSLTSSKQSLTLPLPSSFPQPSSSSDSGDVRHIETEMAAKSPSTSQHTCTLSVSEKSNSVISNSSAVKSVTDSTLSVDKPTVPKSLAFSKSQKKHISQNLYSPSTALAQLHFSQSIAEAAETTSVTNPNLINFPSTSLDKLNFTPCLTSKVDSQDVDMPCVVSSLSSPGLLEAATPLSVCSTSSSTCSSTVTSPSNIPGKVILRSRDNRAKRTLIRPNSIAFSKYPTFDLGSDCQESPSSGSSTSQDDASEMYMLQNGKRTKHSDAGDKFRMGKYSEREVYKQISAMESAMLKSQVYEASRKARSLDDILSSEVSSSSGCVTSVLQKSSRHCGLAMDRFGSSAIYENLAYRCRGSSDPYQSNSSISSSGSHSSLHGSMEIIQVS